MAKLTRRLISQSRVMARGKRIRDVQRLVDTYGGRKSGWVKKSSPRVEIGGHQYEYHWYEHPSIGRVELKRKRVNNV
jgi:hypothetical protein